MKKSAIHCIANFTSAFVLLYFIHWVMLNYSAAAKADPNLWTFEPEETEQRKRMKQHQTIDTLTTPSADLVPAP